MPFNTIAEISTLLQDWEDVGIFALEDGRLTFASRGFAALLGLHHEEALSGRTLLEIIRLAPAQDPSGLSALATRENGSLSLPLLVDANGTQKHIELTVHCKRVGETRIAFGFFVDRTSQVENEQRTFATQRLEAVGQLAGGLAHDFNNLLVVIIANAQMLLDDLEQPFEPAAIRELVDQILAASNRAGTLVRQLLAFARRQITDRQRVSVPDILTRFEPLLTRLLGEEISLSVNVTGPCPEILADVGQVEQAIMNLAVNARDAMPTGGSLSIEVSPVQAPEGVSIVVRDTGTGMTPEVLAHAGEPFFTTKPLGHGTGLGLATVNGLVSRHGGTFRLESTPQSGTIATIFLPTQGTEGE